MREHLLPRFLLAFLLALGLALAALTRPLAPGFALSFSPLTAFPLHLGHRLGQNLRAAWSAPAVASIALVSAIGPSTSRPVSSHQYASAVQCRNDKPGATRAV